MERFNLWERNDLEVREEYQRKISNRFAVLENLCDSEDINRAWENIKENIKNLPQNEECVRFFRSKEAG